MSRRWTMAFVAVVLLGAAIAVVVAQEQPKAPVVPDAGAKKAVPAPDRPAAKEARKTDALSLRARAEQAAMARMLKMMSTAPAIAVAGDHVYVVKGNVLYQFAVDGLTLVAKAELEPRAAPEKAAREAVKRRKVEREPAPAEVR